MSRILATGCCAVFLVFGFVAGAGHVHDSADHHEAMRGLHLDHAHLGHHEPVSPENGNARGDAKTAGHHGGDAHYLTATALRSFDSGLRVMPVIVSVGGSVNSPANLLVGSHESPAQLRGPPNSGPARLRAPPA